MRDDHDFTVIVFYLVRTFRLLLVLHIYAISEYFFMIYSS